MDSVFSPGKSLWNSLEYLVKTRERFNAFHELSPDKVSLCYFQYYQLAAAAYDWKPDLIIELGRGYGNSTFVFTDVMNEINGKVISLCNEKDWRTLMVPKISHLVNDQWFKHLDAREVSDLVLTDLSEEINSKKRILIFWDAHGFQIAEYVLGSLLPLMKDKECLVLIHDMTDRRFNIEDDSYQRQRLWRPETANEGSAKIRLNNIESSSEQLISVLDFCARNHLELKSADESFYNDLSDAQKSELNEQLGDGFNLQGHWVYFAIDGSREFEKLHFPFFDRTVLILEDRFQREYLRSFDKGLKQIEFGLYSQRLNYYEKLRLALRILFS